MPAPHKCTKEAEIAEIHTKVNALWHTIEGNGQPGLNDTVVRLRESVDNLQRSIENQSERVRARTGWTIAAAGVVITGVNVLLTHIM